VGPRAGLDAVVKGKIPRPLPGIEPRSSYTMRVFRVFIYSVILMCNLIVLNVRKMLNYEFEGRGRKVSWRILKYYPKKFYTGTKEQHGKVYKIKYRVRNRTWESLIQSGIR
jgi:hypothetical protein